MGRLLGIGLDWIHDFSRGFWSGFSHTRWSVQGMSLAFGALVVVVFVPSSKGFGVWVTVMLSIQY